MGRVHHDFPSFRLPGSPPSLFAPAELPALESKYFSRVLQHMAITATVRIQNKTQNSEGSGVIVRPQGGFVYVLTAAHLVEGVETVSIATYSAGSYPNAQKSTSRFR